MWFILNCIIWRIISILYRVLPVLITSHIAHRRSAKTIGACWHKQIHRHCISCWTHKQPPLVGLMLHPPLQWPLFLNFITMETGASAAPAWKWRVSFHKGDGGSLFAKFYLCSSVMGICNRTICVDCGGGFAFWLWCVWPFSKQLLTESPWVDLAPQPVLHGRH